MADLGSTVLSCLLSASSAFDVPSGLLYSVIKVESDFNARAVAHANNGTRSVGLMQVNSVWFDKLADAGIREQDLFDPCTNIQVGAWILSTEVKRYGYTWEAIGAYYAGPFDVPGRGWRLKHYHGYADKVLKVWERLQRQSRASDDSR